MQTAQLCELRQPKKLVENRISFAGPESELSIYDTYSMAQRVALEADQLLYCGMVTGRKIMHQGTTDEERVFLPHESFVIAPGESVEIDFPEASRKNPTTCLTIEIAREKVDRISQRMADQSHLRKVADRGQYQAPYLHTHHTPATQHLLKRMVQLYSENHPDRDTMVDLSITELIIRLLRHQEREFLLSFCRETPDHSGLTQALEYIERHLCVTLDMDQLCRVACMSRSRLYSTFRDQVGCSPIQLQQQLRLKSAAERIGKGESITRLCYELGFSSPSHFSRRFRELFGVSPRGYRRRLGST